MHTTKYEEDFAWQKKPIVLRLISKVNAVLNGFLQAHLHVQDWTGYWMDLNV